jgi:polyisoprenyl-phosphate glycosyltransferase
LLSHARRMIVSSRARILRFVTMGGIFSTLASLALGLFFILLKLFNPTLIPVKGWASLFVVTTFLGGISIMLLSIALEYLTTVLLHVHGKPAFFIVDRSLDALALRYFKDRIKH